MINKKNPTNKHLFELKVISSPNDLLVAAPYGLVGLRGSCTPPTYSTTTNNTTTVNKCNDSLANANGGLLSTVVDNTTNNTVSRMGNLDRLIHVLNTNLPDPAALMRNPNLTKQALTQKVLPIDQKQSCLVSQSPKRKITPSTRSRSKLHIDLTNYAYNHTFACCKFDCFYLLTLINQILPGSYYVLVLQIGGDRGYMSQFSLPDLKKKKKQKKNIMDKDFIKCLACGCFLFIRV